MRLLIVFLVITGWGTARAWNLEGAAEYSSKTGEVALAVRKSGSTVLERYHALAHPAQRRPVLSITKNLAALLVFAAEREKLLTLDEKVSDTITEWRKDPLRSQVTIRHLLTQTSGLATGYASLYRRGVPDKNLLAVRVPAQMEPNRAFAYGPSHFEILEEVLHRKLAARGETTLQFFSRKLGGFTGCQTEGWRVDSRGQPFLSTGAHMTLREMVRFGEFVMNQGRWLFIPMLDGRRMQQIAVGSEANPMYGLTFWNNRLAGRTQVIEIDPEQAIGSRGGTWGNVCLSRSAPTDLVAMIGSRGQRIYFSPSQKLVLARQGNSGDFRDTAFLNKLFSQP